MRNYHNTSFKDIMSGLREGKLKVIQYSNEIWIDCDKMPRFGSGATLYSIVDVNDRNQVHLSFSRDFGLFRFKWIKGVGLRFFPSLWNLPWGNPEYIFDERLPLDFTVELTQFIDKIHQR